MHRRSALVSFALLGAVLTGCSAALPPSGASAPPPGKPAADFSGKCAELAGGGTKADWSDVTAAVGAELPAGADCVVAAVDTAATAANQYYLLWYLDEDPSIVTSIRDAIPTDRWTIQIDQPDYVVFVGTGANVVSINYLPEPQDYVQVGIQLIGGTKTG
ncbi:MAG: hypothetical protein DI534_06830 [Leifsonia xyli]|nr:MAG: hypothetical protein DI534_06830 [Leifsonia xyli]